MNRPRVAAVVSGIAASTAAFLVVSRWQLAGTLTGAAVIPVVYALVSHCSIESLDRLGKWTRRRIGREVSEQATAVGFASAAEPAEKRGPERGSHKIQWLLAVLASLALVVSVYSLTQPGTVESTIVREKVIEKTVTVTTQAVSSVAQAASEVTSTTTTLGGTEPSTVATEPAGTSPDQTGAEVDPSSTTTDANSAKQEEEPSSATSETTTTTASLP